MIKDSFMKKERTRKINESQPYNRGDLDRCRKNKTLNRNNSNPGKMANVPVHQEMVMTGPKVTKSKAVIADDNTAKKYLDIRYSAIATNP